MSEATTQETFKTEPQWEFNAPQFYDFTRASDAGGLGGRPDDWFDTDATKGKQSRKVPIHEFINYLRVHCVEVSQQGSAASISRGLQSSPNENTRSLCDNCRSSVAGRPCGQGQGKGYCQTCPVSFR